MTDKKDGPGQTNGPKAGDRTAQDASGKRPFATIDLKAVEVPPEAQRSSAAGKPADTAAPKAPPAAKPRDVGQAEAARKVASAAAAVTGSQSGQSVPAAGASASKPASASATSPKQPAAEAPASSGAAAAASVAPRSSGGFGSHVLTAVAAAALALVAAPFVLPTVTRTLEDAGLTPPRPLVAPEIAQRIAALEKRTAAPAKTEADPVAAKAEAAAQDNRRRIDTLAQSLAQVTEAQGVTARTTGELQARLAKEPPIADVGQRLVALEGMLTELSAAAKAEPDRAGRIPQLAQMTGRIADLESALSSRLGELRKEVGREIETRIAPVNEASESARSATQRLDREIGGLKAESNRIATGVDQVKTATERLQLALKAAQDDTAKVAASLDTARRDLETRIGGSAKPSDVTTALTPIATQLSALEKSLTNVVKSEGERNATAERIVLSLELGNLKRAMERGAPYSRELAEVAKISGQRIDLAPLDRYRNEGVPTIAELGRSFRDVANAILDADAEKTDGTVVDRLLSGAKTFVRVRKTTSATGDKSAEATVARMETALKAGRLGDVLAEAKALQHQPAIAKDWLGKVQARQTVDAALRSIDESLKASLGGAPASAAPAAQKKGQP